MNTLRRTFSVVIVGVLVLALVSAQVAAAQDGTETFTRFSVGSPPSGWSATITGAGKSVWTVEKCADAPSQPNILKQSAEVARGSFPLCIKDGTNLKDGFVEVKFKPISGKIDQGAGVVWRCKDKDNYYVCRANALEDNVVLYKVENGKRSSLDIVGRKGGYGIEEKISPQIWNTLRVDFSGDLFTVLFNGKVLFKVQDKTFTQGGKVGLWTKADTVMMFDDFCYAGGGQTWTFDSAPAGSIPDGWRAAETNGRGHLGKWEVVKDESAPTPPNVIALTQTKNSSGTFNLLIAEKTSFQDLEIEVKVKAMTGQEDQGGGPIWRAKDEKNYYTARWNPLEDNFRVYYVKDSRRTQIGNADVKLDPKAWHEIEIRHVGTKITAGLDGKKLIEVEDNTFAEPGKIGLWTKADAATAFDEIEIEKAKTALADNDEDDDDEHKGDNHNDGDDHEL